MKRKDIIRMADRLDRAHRIGAKEDKPEGMRLIKISDTCAKEISCLLRACHFTMAMKTHVQMTDSCSHRSWERLGMCGTTPVIRCCDCGLETLDFGAV
jgi:hypothetical protein